MPQFPHLIISAKTRPQGQASLPTSKSYHGAAFKKLKKEKKKKIGFLLAPTTQTPFQIFPPSSRFIRHNKQQGVQ
jgi:hypothetical protein